MNLKTGCYCNETFDIRCCCWVNDDTFDTCKQKVSTTYEHIMNTYPLYKKVEKFGIESVEIYIKDICRLDDKQWNEIVEIYNNLDTE